jgi:hypothetical protein
MSKERKIDDEDLAEIAGAGGVMDHQDADLDDNYPYPDSSFGQQTDADVGGTGPNDPDPVGGGGSGNQTPSAG